MNAFKQVNIHLSALLCIYALLLLPLTFLGYGSDNDTYGVLTAGGSTWGEGIPAMSRNPGYWLYEFIVYLLNLVGGFYLTNIFSLVCAILVLVSFNKLTKELEIQHRKLLLLCLAFNPWFIIASTSTMDYMFALLLMVWSFRALNSNRFIMAGIFAGLAIATRLGSIFPLTGIYVAFIISNYRNGNIRSCILSALTSLGITLIFYFPSWYVVGMNFNFMQPGMGDKSLWSLKMYVGRFFYKIIYLFGLPAFLFLGGLLLYSFSKKNLKLSKKSAEKISIGAIFGNLILFAKYPIEISYLIPSLFFVLIVIGNFLNSKGNIKLLYCLLITILSYSFINLSAARPNVHNLGSDAVIGLEYEWGPLVKDIAIRLKLKKCSSMQCFEEIFADPSQIK
jgi:hypothetical protein